MRVTLVVGSTDILVLANTGDEPVSLDGWRFCTQNSTSGPVFSAPGGLDGIVVPVNQSIAIRYANDALPTFPTHHNASDVGPLAPFELDAYAMSLYSPDASGEVDFANSQQMAEHIQWKRGFVGDDLATFCGPIAQDAGQWADASVWIPVRVSLYLIEFFDRDLALADGPEDYNVLQDCPADLSDDGLLNFFDVSVFLQQYQQGVCPDF